MSKLLIIRHVLIKFISNLYTVYIHLKYNQDILQSYNKSHLFMNNGFKTVANIINNCKSICTHG